MSDTVKIQIAKIGRKQLPSKFKEGEFYNITTILDKISGRKGAAMGAFADSWKVGDEVEGIWEKRTWKDKDGFEQESWSIKNPKAGTGKGGSWGPRKPSIVDAYMIAAALAPVILGEKVNLDKVEKLANEVLKRLSASTPAPEAGKAEKTVDLDEEEGKTTKKKSAKKEDDDFDVEDESDEDAPAKAAASDDDDDEF